MKDQEKKCITIVEFYEYGKKICTRPGHEQTKFNNFYTMTSCIFSL